MYRLVEGTSEAECNNELDETGVTDVTLPNPMSLA